MHVWKYAILAFWLAAGLASCRSQEAPSPQRAEASEGSRSVPFPPAQHFALKDYRGNAIDLRDYKGKVVVLNFWATWCGPCRYEIPHLVELRKGFAPKEVAIVGVSLDQGEDEQILPLLERFVDRYGINYPIVLDNKFELIRQFYKRDLATLAVPITYIFDQQGQIYRTHLGVPRSVSGRSDPGTVLGEEIQTLLDRG